MKIAYSYSFQSALYEYMYLLNEVCQVVVSVVDPPECACAGGAVLAVVPPLLTEPVPHAAHAAPPERAGVFIAAPALDATFCFRHAALTANVYIHVLHSYLIVFVSLYSTIFIELGFSLIISLEGVAGTTRTLRHITQNRRM